MVNPTATLFAGDGGIGSLTTGSNVTLSTGSTLQIKLQYPTGATPVEGVDGDVVMLDGTGGVFTPGGATLQLLPDVATFPVAICRRHRLPTSSWTAGQITTSIQTPHSRISPMELRTATAQQPMPSIMAATRLRSLCMPCRSPRASAWSPWAARRCYGGDAKGENDAKTRFYTRRVTCGHRHHRRLDWHSHAGIGPRSGVRPFRPMRSNLRQLATGAFLYIQDNGNKMIPYNLIISGTTEYWPQLEAPYLPTSSAGPAPIFPTVRWRSPRPMHRNMASISTTLPIRSTACRRPCP